MNGRFFVVQDLLESNANIEAKDNDKDKFLNEGADLLFHYLLLLNSKGHTLEEVIAILKQRHQK